ncbi:hypothetical protein BKA82DRAFT_4012344 [Pisolithus tinctorius]|nr:hypothetical protein BKA82DRAFT_4012344 [Pisolithus tinctorius]
MSFAKLQDYCAPLAVPHSLTANADCTTFTNRGHATLAYTRVHSRSFDKYPTKRNTKCVSSLEVLGYSNDTLVHIIGPGIDTDGLLTVKDDDGPMFSYLNRYDQIRLQGRNRYMHIVHNLDRNRNTRYARELRAAGYPTGYSTAIRKKLAPDKDGSRRKSITYASHASADAGNSMGLSIEGEGVEETSPILGTSPHIIVASAIRHTQNLRVTRNEPYTVSQVFYHLSFPIGVVPYSASLPHLP